MSREPVLSTLRPRLANGSTKHGDAVADRVRDEFQKLAEEGRDRLDSLADADWGPLATGKFQAQEPATRPDGIRSDGPKSGIVRTFFQGIVAILNAVNNWQKIAALFLIAAVTALFIWLKLR